MTISERIGFIGAGQMARALARGMADARLVTGAQLAAYDPDPDAQASFLRAAPGATVAADPQALAAGAAVVVLAVKPQVLPVVAAQWRALLGAGHLLVSVVAGASIAELESRLGLSRIVRVMPNTPCLVGRGASAYAPGPQASAADLGLVDRILSAVGLAVPVTESMLDVVTGLSGSGPAYVFTLVEAMTDGAVRMGMPRATAAALAVQTVLGSAMMLSESGEHPAVLRDRVASPGGTTVAGMRALEDRGFRAAVAAAVEAAARRATELGQPERGN